MAKPPKKTEPLPSPSDKEREAIAAAKEWVAGKTDTSPPKMHLALDGGAVACGPTYDDLEGFYSRWSMALGSRSSGLVDAFMTQMLNASSNPADADIMAREVRQAGAFVAALEPRNEIETALAMQMWAIHMATMSLAGNVARATRRDALADYTGQLNKTARTFAAQVETLSKLRTGGKQQVEVRHVYVDARTQTVVNACPGDMGGRGGAGQQIDGQPHAHALTGPAAAHDPALWGADPERDAMPRASDQGQGALSDARGAEPRCTEGQAQRELHGRALDCRDDGSAGDGSGPCEDVP